MKRKLVAALLGIAASVSLVSSAHAQGRVFFNNYGGSGANATFAPVNYGAGAGGTQGAGVNNTFTAGLWYFLGTTTLASGNGLLPSGWEVASITQQINAGATAGAGGEGLFVGPVATISDYVSGPITFSVVAYNGASYGASGVRGNSAGFAGAPATGQSPTANFGPAFSSFSVLPVPEPSIFALSGLGAAALMLIRRKK